LNAYVGRALQGAFDALAVPYHLFLAHRLDYDVGLGRPSAVPIQRLGSRVGLASLGPAYLSVHPRFGPWFAYRAVAVLDLPPEIQPAPRTEPCTTCPAPCGAALEQALGPRRSLDVEENWQRWLAVRDACPVQAEARYPDDQIRYHYTKDPRWLRRNS
jgi:methylmalonic aciduria homocystinuria type C protein